MGLFRITAMALYLVCLSAFAQEGTKTEAPAEGTLARDLFGDDFGRQSGLLLFASGHVRRNWHYCGVK